MNIAIKTATMIRFGVGVWSTLTVAGCVGDPAFLTPATSRSVTPTQLEASIGLKEGEYGRFTLDQLVQIKSLVESDDISESERHARLGYIKNSVLGYPK